MTIHLASVRSYNRAPPKSYLQPILKLWELQLPHGHSPVASNCRMLQHPLASLLSSPSHSLSPGSSRPSAYSPCAHHLSHAFEDLWTSCWGRRAGHTSLGCMLSSGVDTIFSMPVILSGHPKMMAASIRLLHGPGWTTPKFCLPNALCTMLQKSLGALEIFKR